MSETITKTFEVGHQVFTGHIRIDVRELTGPNTIPTRVSYTRFCTGDTINPPYNTLKVYVPKRFEGILLVPVGSEAYRERNKRNPSYWKQFEVKNLSSETIKVYAIPRNSLDSTWELYFGYKDGYFYPVEEYAVAIGKPNYYGSILTESHPYFVGGTFVNYNSLVGTGSISAIFPPNRSTLLCAFGAVTRKANYPLETAFLDFYFSSRSGKTFPLVLWKVPLVTLVLPTTGKGPDFILSEDDIEQMQFPATFSARFKTPASGYTANVYLVNNSNTICTLSTSTETEFTWFSDSINTLEPGTVAVTISAPGLGDCLSYAELACQREFPKNFTQFVPILRERTASKGTYSPKQELIVFNPKDWSEYPEMYFKVWGKVSKEKGTVHLVSLTSNSFEVRSTIVSVEIDTTSYAWHSASIPMLNSLTYLGIKVESTVYVYLEGVYLQINPKGTNFPVYYECQSEFEVPYGESSFPLKNFVFKDHPNIIGYEFFTTFKASNSSLEAYIVGPDFETFKNSFEPSNVYVVKSTPVSLPTGTVSMTLVVNAIDNASESGSYIKIQYATPSLEFGIRTRRDTYYVPCYSDEWSGNQFCVQHTVDVELGTLTMFDDSSATSADGELFLHDCLRLYVSANNVPPSYGSTTLPNTLPVVRGTIQYQTFSLTAGNQSRFAIQGYIPSSLVLSKQDYYLYTSHGSIYVNLGNDKTIEWYPLKRLYFSEKSPTFYGGGVHDVQKPYWQLCYNYSSLNRQVPYLVVEVYE